ncbi:NAD-dependent epimerase/dehydratase family protein [Paenibacillus sp. TSA_86.1]|uniref:NAD-dependent epimerase/dehydratase family protein n=1 Tax=Paenibacillus sp. TSA_86.1 TaxID=3415649 RepID=UPI0040468438
MNTTLESDFEYIQNANLPWERLKNKTVFITGGTGFIGSLLVRFFDYMNKKYQWNTKIVTLVRDQSKAEILLDSVGVEIIKGDICQLPQIEMDIDFVFHCAAITNSKAMIEEPVEVTEGIVQGTFNLMRLSHVKNVESIVFLSSMEVYGVNDGITRVSEKDLGHIEIYNARNCYPLGKRMAENICFSFFSEYKVPVKVARLAQTFGAGISDNENRVFAQFARSVLYGQDIILHTDGAAMGNYCYSADAIQALLYILFNGKEGQEYNVVNEQASLSIREMAEIVAENVSGGNIKVKFDIPPVNKFGYATPSNVKLSAAKLLELGWEPKYGLEQMYKRMIDYMTLTEQKVTV